MWELWDDCDDKAQPSQPTAALPNGRLEHHRQHSHSSAVAAGAGAGFAAGAVLSLALVLVMRKKRGAGGREHLHPKEEAGCRLSGVPGRAIAH